MKTSKVAFQLLVATWTLGNGNGCASIGSRVVMPLERSPVQIDTLYPESIITLGCLNGEDPVVPGDGSVPFDEWCSHADPIAGSACGTTGRAATCQPTRYASVGMYCASGLYEVVSTNGTRIGLTPHVWCVPDPSSPWEQLGSTDSYICPLGKGSCAMTCGFDVDWCSSDAGACVTDAEGINVKSIAECVSQPEEYLTESCRGIEVASETPAPSPQPVSKQSTLAPSPKDQTVETVAKAPVKTPQTPKEEAPQGGSDQKASSGAKSPGTSMVAYGMLFFLSM